MSDRKSNFGGLERNEEADAEFARSAEVTQPIKVSKGLVVDSFGFDGVEITLSRNHAGGNPERVKLCLTVGHGSHHQYGVDFSLSVKQAREFGQSLMDIAK